jgi:hypothetical protein
MSRSIEACVGGTSGRPEQSITDLVAFFNKLKSQNGWTYEDLYDAYFAGRPKLGTMKSYLRQGPPKYTQAATVQAFEQAFRRVRIESDAAYRLHRTILDAIARDDPTQREFELYEGAYTFWRHGRFGLVTGIVEARRHRDADFPYHEQLHTQTTSADGAPTKQFRCEGGIYWLARNICFLSIGAGEFRITLVRRVVDPRREPIIGMFLSEQHDGYRDPFAGKVVLCHEGWLAENRAMVDDDWVRSQLRNGAQRGPDGGQDLLLM